MPITYDKENAKFIEIVTVEEAEGLVEWLQNNKNAVVDLTSCEHMHSACLQALLVFKPKMVNAPEHINFSV